MENKVMTTSALIEEKDSSFTHLLTIPVLCNFELSDSSRFPSFPFLTFHFVAGNLRQTFPISIIKILDKWGCLSTSPVSLINLKISRY